MKDTRSMPMRIYSLRMVLGRFSELSRGRKKPFRISFMNPSLSANTADNMKKLESRIITKLLSA